MSQIISVMIPTWNPQPDYLKQALDSVLMQDWGPEKMQIAVVDDCSNERDVKKWLHEQGLASRVEFYQNEQNIGIGGGWNGCINNARGQWVHILHQDDVVENGYYDILNHDLVKEHQQEIGFILTRNCYIKADGLKKTFSKRVKDEIYFDKEFYKIMHHVDMQCPGVLVPKRIYDELGLFREELQYSLDREMWTRIASKYGVLYNPNPLCSFRTHEHSQSALLSRSDKNVVEYAHAIELICSHLPESVRSQNMLEMKKKMTRGLINKSRNRPLKDKIKFWKLIWKNGYRPGLIRFFWVI